MVPTFILPQVKLLNSLGIKELVISDMEWEERSKGHYCFIDADHLEDLEGIKDLKMYTEAKTRNTYFKWH